MKHQVITDTQGRTIVKLPIEASERTIRRAERKLGRPLNYLSSNFDHLILWTGPDNTPVAGVVKPARWRPWMAHAPWSYSLGPSPSKLARRLQSAAMKLLCRKAGAPNGMPFPNKGWVAELRREVFIPPALLAYAFGAKCLVPRRPPVLP